MIVLDEQLDHHLVLKPLMKRTKGRVLSICELRPGTVVKDEAIPALLRQLRNVMFVTTNVSDFWRRVPAHLRYSIVCVPLPTNRQAEIPNFLTAFQRHAAFRTARLRAGKVVRLGPKEIWYYAVNEPAVPRLAW